MIASKSQSQATLPEKRSGPLRRARLAIASIIIHCDLQLKEALKPCPRWSKLQDRTSREELQLGR
jgi:hypothetical protein